MASQAYDYTHFIVSAPRPHVAHVEINRPAKLNAFSQEVWLEFRRVFEQLSVDEDVRAVVLTGKGDRAFTSGLDVKAAGQDPVLGRSQDDPPRWAKGARGHIEEFQNCITAMEKCEKPVICILHDIAIGLAIDIACCADIRFATSNAIMAVKEVDIGLAADIGTLARLPKIVGATTWVKEVCLTARNFSAEEALRVGFVSNVFESKAAAVDAALGIAAAMAEKSPVAVQGTKELLNYGREHSVVDSLQYTKIWNSVALQGNDFKAAVGASMTKKKPKFAKL